MPGSGKTSYFAKHFAQTHVSVSRDVLGTPLRERALFLQCLGEGRSVVIDNTNATRDLRAPFVREAKAAGYSVRAIFFDVPTRTSIGRNNHRKDKKPIPVPALLRMVKMLQVPTEEEGFDAVVTVDETYSDPVG